MSAVQVSRQAAFAAPATAGRPQQQRARRVVVCRAQQEEAGLRRKAAAVRRAWEGSGGEGRS